IERVRVKGATGLVLGLLGPRQYKQSQPETKGGTSPMKRVAVGIFICIGVVFHQLPLAAEPLPSKIHVYADRSMRLTGAEQMAIVDALKKTHDLLVRKRSGWGCVGPADATFEGDEYDYLADDLAPVKKIPVHINVVVIGPADPHGYGYSSVILNALVT